MDEYLMKLSSISNISTEGILAGTDTIKDSTDNRVTLMKWESDLIYSRIKHIVATHHHFYASSAWL